jgi:tRNA-uridine 2-sulfurtransferase
MVDQPESRKTRPVVAVAMSGGVDSSVAAALLVRQGYPVIGVMLRLWSEEGMDDRNRCCTPDAVAQARRVAAQLDIPFYTLDAREVFREQIVDPFVKDYIQGLTPNPCIRCNQLIRWGFLKDRVTALGADTMATGHYARIISDDDGIYRLLRGVDPFKDQSYALSHLSQDQLRHTLFPLGELKKTQVRSLALEQGLSVARRPDSQDLCFVGEGDYRQFIQRQAPGIEKSGPILNRQGEVVGEHMGLAFYTIGQRKGLKIAAKEPLYVLAKDMQKNALIVGARSELGSMALTAVNVNWIAGNPPADAFRAVVKIRYKAEEAWGVITPLADGRINIQFDNILRDITPGQAAVMYDGETCLGSGMIEPFD